MNLIELIKSFFSSNKMVLKQTDTNLFTFEPFMKDIAAPFFKQSRGEILHTIYRIGPSMLTSTYPVNTDVLQEIISSDGLIGPNKYKDQLGTIDHLINYDNEWFLFEHPELQPMLKSDLLKLAKVHNKTEAYSLLGSISESAEQFNFWKVGAHAGNPCCMVDYAISLYCMGYTSEGFNWLKKGADLGNGFGALLTAISYNYGTLCKIDYAQAAHYYLLAIEHDEAKYAYVNLGALLVDSGYYHTALRYFTKAYNLLEMDNFEDGYYGRNPNFLSNINTCKSLLFFPYEERSKRVVMQAHSRSLDAIFCSNHIAQSPYMSELIPDDTPRWVPTSEKIDIDPEDMAEINAANKTPVVVVDKHEDFVFPVYKVSVQNHTIFSTHRELVFLEKNCHVELNKYIQENILSLRAAFKMIGYQLYYQPAHLYDLNNFTDLIGSYVADHPNQKIQLPDSNRLATDYWDSMIGKEKLPTDCAGFLRFIPNPDRNSEPGQNFEYILFPYRPGTDWPRAFATLFDHLRHDGKTIELKPSLGLSGQYMLPEGAYLNISLKYDLTLCSREGEVLAEIKLTPLPKVMLLALLNHPEGLVIKNLVDIRDELLNYYKAIVGEKAESKNIDLLIDPTNNSANEKISRIKAAFTKALSSRYKDDIHLFLPKGKRGEAYRIAFRNYKKSSN